MLRPILQDMSRPALPQEDVRRPALSPGCVSSRRPWGGPCELGGRWIAIDVVMLVGDAGRNSGGVSARSKSSIWLDCRLCWEVRPVELC
jgi:hypothetical protein